MNVRLSGFFLFFLIACSAPLYAVDPQNTDLDFAAKKEEIVASKKDDFTSIPTPQTTLSTKINNCISSTWNTLTNAFSHKNQHQILRGMDIINACQVIGIILTMILRTSKKLSEPFPAEIAAAIEKIGMQNQVTVYEQKTGNIGFAMLNKSITIDPEFYAQATPDQRSFVIGHELVHLRDHHHLKSILLHLSLLYLVPRFLKECRETIAWALTKANDYDFVKKRPELQHYLNGAKKVNAAVLKSPFVITFLQAYCMIRLSQYFEKTCDLESARILNSANGGISFFKNLLTKENQRKTSYFSYLNPLMLLHKTQEFLGLESHPPLQDRIQYLEKALKA